jgi:hypothetical protein
MEEERCFVNPDDEEQPPNNNEANGEAAEDVSQKLHEFEDQ